MFPRTRLAFLFALAACGEATPQAPDQPVAEQQPPEKPAPPAETAPHQPASDLPPIPDSPAPAPPSLIGVLSIPSPSTFLSDLGSYLGSIRAEAASMATPRLLDEVLGELTELDIDGIDYSKPVYVLFLSSGNNLERLLVGTAQNRQTVDNAARRSEAIAQHQKGWFALGTRRALELGAPFALSTLPNQKLSKSPTLSIHVDRIRTQYESTVSAMLPLMESELKKQGGDDAEAARMMLHGALSMFRQTSRIEVTADVSATDASLLVDVVTDRDGGIAKFAARQRPATFREANLMANAAAIGAGVLDWGDALDGMLSLSRAPMNKIYGSGADKMIAATKASARLFDGEFGFAVGRDGKASVVEGTFSSSKPDEMANKFYEMMAATTKVGAKDGYVEVRGRAKSFRYRRIWVGMFTTKPKKSAPPETKQALEKTWGKGGSQTCFAVTGGKALLSIGNRAKKRIRARIDQAVANKPASSTSAITRALDRARAAKESLLILLDGPTILSWRTGASGAPGRGGELASIGFGFQDDQLHVRLTVPASQAKAMASALTP